MKDIYIVDIRSANVNGKTEGHYYAVAENYTDVFSEYAKVFVAGGPVYADRFENNFALPYDSIKKKGALRDKIATAINAIYALKKIRDQVIVFQCSAISTVCLALALIKPKSDVYLIQYDSCMKDSKWRQAIFNRTSKRIKGIICPGKEIGLALEVPYCVVPDYIYCGKSLVDIVSEKKYDFGMYGILAQGKGIFEAAEALAKTNYRVKIAGKVAGLPEDKKMIERLMVLCKNHHNIELEIGYLSDKKYHDYIRNTKYVVLNYSDSYALRSSGVILDSIYSYTPVIVRRRKYAEFVGEENIGIVYDKIDEVNFEEILCDEYRARFVANIDNYLHNHEKYKRSLLQFILGGIGEQ